MQQQSSAHAVRALTLSRFVRIARSAPALAASFLFFANGFVFANWVVRIPSVKAELALSEATLGLALLAYAAGGILAMPVCGALIGRVGSGRLATVSGVFYCLAFCLTGFAPSAAALAAALFVVGAGNGALDVSMNAQADAAESLVGQRIMSFSHAMFSLGLAVGTLPAGAFAAAEVATGVHLLVIGATMAVGVVFAARFASPDRTIDGPPQPSFALPRGPLLLFGLICLCGAVVEGGMNDWVAVFVEDTRGLDPVHAAGAFGAFASAMFIARLLGDVATERHGAARVVRAGFVLAASGMALTLVGGYVAMLVGLAAVGLGVAAVFPAVFRAAGRLPGRAPGPSMAAAVTLGYAGFLVGPPVIGFIAEWAGLSLALFLLVPLCLLGAAFAGALKEAD